MTLILKRQENRVIGHPLLHTQSPLLHAALYQHLGLNARMQVLAGPELPLLMQIIKDQSINLTAVTAPYKEAVLHYLDEASVEVRALKACNTLIQQKGKLFGYNTDLDGIAFALDSTPIQGERVLVVGSGGAARALGYYLNIKKADIYWLNRTMKKASVLASEFGGTVVTERELGTFSFKLIINSTPLGTYPELKQSPLPEYRFNSKQTVFDLVYHPRMTALLKQAKKQKAKIISGLEMFIGQGLKQVELLRGEPFDSSELRGELETLLINNQRVNER